MDARRSGFLVAFALLAIACWPVRLPAEEGNQLEITIRWSDGRSATWNQSIPEDQGRDISSRPDLVTSKYLVTARKKLAERQGYTETIYGADYWKIPQVAKWFFVLKDPRSNRVIASNRP